MPDASERRFLVGLNLKTVYSVPSLASWLLRNIVSSADDSYPMERFIMSVAAVRSHATKTKGSFYQINPYRLIKSVFT